MTRRDFFKKIGWFMLSLPLFSLAAKWTKPKASPKEAMYYKNLAG